jgi:alanine dehydrogenase
MPGAVPYTSTLALTNATLPYALQLANKGWERACAENEELQKGLNIANGKILYKGVAEAWNLPFNEDLILGFFRSPSTRRRNSRAAAR